MICEISKLRPRTKTPGDDLDKMVESLKKYGCLFPLHITNNYKIIDGDLRYHAALKLGFTHLPVVKHES